MIRTHNETICQSMHAQISRIGRDFGQKRWTSDTVNAIIYSFTMWRRRAKCILGSMARRKVYSYRAWRRVVRCGHWSMCTAIVRPSNFWIHVSAFAVIVRLVVTQYRQQSPRISITIYRIWCNRWMSTIVKPSRWHAVVQQLRWEVHTHQFRFIVCAAEM